MSRSAHSARATRLQKVASLWTHNEDFSKEEVLFNEDRFPELGIREGTLVRIIALKVAVNTQDFEEGAMNEHAHEKPRVVTLDENGKPIKGGRERHKHVSFLFVAKRMPPEKKARYPHMHISISETVARLHGFQNRSQVAVYVADEDTYAASHVEVTFRDCYMTRGDMWNLVMLQLSKRAVYRGQKILFMGTIRVTVTNVFVNGKQKQCAYFSPRTKPIIRSESARYTIFIQMSREMWDFDAEGSGETVFNKVTDGFLPKMFSNWSRAQSHHLVTIILFTRIEYEQDAGSMHDSWTSAPPDSKHNAPGTKLYQDFYRVVVSEVASEDWIHILRQLKKEYRSFLKDVSLVNQHHPEKPPGETPDCVIAGTPSIAPQGNVLEAINMAAAQFSKDYIDRDLVRTGKSIVVITPGTGVFEVDFNKLKLTTDTIMGTGIGIDLVCLAPMPLHSVPLFVYKTPQALSQSHQVTEKSEGPNGSFGDATPRQQEDYLSKTITASNVGRRRSTILESEPFPDEVTYGMPHWLDVSFWPDPSPTQNDRRSRQRNATKPSRSAFRLRCPMYELQMMGVMENELSNVSIPYIEEDPLYPFHLSSLTPNYTASHTPVGSYPRHSSPQETRDPEKQKYRSLTYSWMRTYDDNVFRPVAARKEAEEKHVRFTEKAEQEQARSQAMLRGSLLSASFESHSQSLGSSARPPKGPNFHQIMKEQHRNDHTEGETGHTTPRRRSSLRPGRKHVQLDDTTTVMPYKRGSTTRPRGDENGSSSSSRTSRSQAATPKVSRASSPLKLSRQSSKSTIVEKDQLPAPPTPTPEKPPAARPSGWLSRHISFSGFGFGTTKSTPITAVSTGTSQGQLSQSQLKRKPSQLSILTLSQKSNSEADSTDEERHSKPITIKASSRLAGSSTHSPIEEEEPRSVDTVKHLKRGSNAGTASGSPVKDPGSIFLSKGNIIKEMESKGTLSTSVGKENIPNTLSPTKALVPWIILLNPCNPKKNRMNMATAFRRWHHIFPTEPRVSSIKWKSLTSPASVPLTNEYFPSTKQLTTEYHEGTYQVILNDDDENSSIAAAQTPNGLIKELMAFRLSHGFQFIVGSSIAEFTGVAESEISNIFDESFMSQDGDSCWMSVGNAIHQLTRISEGEVEIRRYNRKPTTAIETSAGVESPLKYKPLIKTAYESQYNFREIVLRPPREEYNWNIIDNFLAGNTEEFYDTLRFWRARFVLIPVELPPRNRRPMIHSNEDTEEEVRLEGIRKLTQLWQRFRHVSPLEAELQKKRKKDPNPLKIEYQTMDPSAIVAAGLGSSLLSEAEPTAPSSQIFATGEKYNTRNIDLHKLARDIQSPEHGIPIVNRFWHLKLHWNCFLGSDLTTWLLENFENIETREEAVDLGNELMRKGLFQHVGKHQFRDGNFFYQFKPEYRVNRSDWFGRPRADKSSIPSTPLSDAGGTKIPPMLPRPHSQSTATTISSVSSNDTTRFRPGSPGNKRKVILSSVLRYNVDRHRRSYRPEYINLHYDRLHNPDNCYHIRIDWMNVTPKLIEDTIAEWSKTVEKYGLRLVELPIAEAARGPERHPFRRPYLVKLALQPPKPLPVLGIDPSRLGSAAHLDRFGYHKALLRRKGFILDMESASSFPPDVEVCYSWGRPDYQYTQYIHRTGLLLAQITDEGDFLLSANRLCSTRAGRDAGKFERGADPEHHHPHPLGHAHNHSHSLPSRRGWPDVAGGVGTGSTRSPFSSPLVQAMQDSALSDVPALAPLTRTRSGGQGGAGAGGTVSSVSSHTGWINWARGEEVKEELESFCQDADTLRRFYEEVGRLSVREVAGGLGAAAAAAAAATTAPTVGSGSGSGSASASAGTTTSSPRLAPAGVGLLPESPSLAAVVLGGGVGGGGKGEHIPRVSLAGSAVAGVTAAAAVGMGGVAGATAAAAAVAGAAGAGGREEGEVRSREGSVSLRSEGSG